MTQSAIQTWFHLSAWLLAPLGLAAMVWWMARVTYPRTKRHVEARGASLRAVAMLTLFWSLPGLLAFILACMPMLYFAHLRKQTDYCVKLIRVNKLQRDDRDLRERCGGLDLDELTGLAAGGRRD